MNNRQERTVHAFSRALIYLDLHPIIPEPPLLMELRHALQGVIHRVEELGQDQAAATYDMKPQVDYRKNILRRGRMMILVRLGAPYFRHSEMEALLQVPHKKSNAQQVAEAALRLADAFEEHRELLAAAGLPPTFLEEMRREAHDLELSARRSATARNRRSLATRDIADELSKGMTIVDQIEGLVMAHHQSDHRSMGLWRQTRRVPKRQGRPPRRNLSRPAATPQLES
jgi:hypothetical protein